MSEDRATPLELECDLVMKGGVTSGIIYPAAIAAIAKDYRLRAIGGTSAGAIGAAAAAAMEFGRRSGRNRDAAVMMASLATQLGAQTDGGPLLLRLFEPDVRTARLFRLLLRIAEAKRGGGMGAILRLLLRTPFWLAILIAGAVVTGLLWLTPAPIAAANILSAMLLLVCGVPVLTAMLSFLYWAPRIKADLAATADNGFGFCSGMAHYKTPVPRFRWPWHKPAAVIEAPSLSEWLHGQFQTLAGLGDAEVLTFGDLWTASHRVAAASREEAFAAAIDHAFRAAATACEAAVAVPDPDGQGGSGSSPGSSPDFPIVEPRTVPRLHHIARDIELALVASDINRAQSVQLPFMRREDRLYAKISDLRALFPESVVGWMIDHKRTNADIEAELLQLEPDDGLRANLIRLPFPEDLPVLFGVRMSLSFPFLFRAVRLYVVRRRADGSGRAELAELWLADGGITSNFPIHLFDAPIPGRPTFCLNLLYHDDELEPDHGLREKPRTGDGADAEALRDAAEIGGSDAPGAADRDSGLPVASSDGGDRKAEDLVYMLRSNKGRLSAYTRFTQGSALGRLAQFGGRIVTTARQWGDNQLLDVAGYRDRIVHIRMLPDEGGFNFDMNAEKIARLQQRGDRAGQVIAARFRPDTTMDPLHPEQRLTLNWANHRFARFRSFLAGLEVAVSRFSEVWARDRDRAGRSDTGPHSVSPSLEQITDDARRGADRLPQKIGYPFRNAQQAELAHEMVKALEALRGIVEDPAWRGIDFVKGEGTSPRPKSVLKLRPPSDTDALAERP